MVDIYVTMGHYAFLREQAACKHKLRPPLTKRQHLTPLIHFSFNYHSPLRTFVTIHIHTHKLHHIYYIYIYAHTYIKHSFHLQVINFHTFFSSLFIFTNFDILPIFDQNEILYLL